MKKNIVDQAHWDQDYQHFHFYMADDCVTEKVDSVLDAFVREHKLSSCFELGCFPGRYLAHFCKKYSLEANGADASAHMDKRFRKWLESEKISVGTLEQGDAFAYIDELCIQKQTFDFVYSLGFIEHFEDYMEVVKYHAGIVADGGLLVIVCPNFRGGIQYLMHRLTDRENLKRHVVRSMNPRKWARLLQKEGFEILEAGYFGGFRFWAGEQKRGLLQQCLLYLFRSMTERRKGSTKEHFLYSSYCILAAEKRGWTFAGQCANMVKGYSSNQ